MFIYLFIYLFIYSLIYSIALFNQMNFQISRANA